MRTQLLILISLALVGCQYDPHAKLYTTSEPKTADIVGTYVLDALDLPPEVGSTRPNVVVELRADGTFAATNVPPCGAEEPGTNFFSSLISGTGHWEKGTLGGLDPGNKSIWGVYLRTPDNRFHPADFTGDKPPYGLIFVLGDPDSGNAIKLKRSALVSTEMLAQTIPPDDGFAPGLLFVVLFFGAVLLVLVGIGIVVGLACLACAAIFVALGVISSSALIAILRRRFTAGLRALHYQLLALVGLPCGIGFLWFACFLFDVQIRDRYILAAGSAIGIATGIIMAFILDRFFRFVVRRILLTSRLRASP